MSTTISVDSTRCEGHAQCLVEAPELFDIDDEGYSVVLSSEVDGEEEQTAENAARACPAMAIILSS